MSIEAMKQALEALEVIEPDTTPDSDAEIYCRNAITSLRAAIASYSQAIAEAEKQEPVAWLDPWTRNNVTTDYDAYGSRGIPLYTTPPQRQPLYPREVKDVLRATGYVTNSQAWELAEEVMKLLAAHGIKE
jgi:hypothetical protein